MNTTPSKDTYSPFAREYRASTNTLVEAYSNRTGMLVVLYSYQTPIGFLDSAGRAYVDTKRYSVTSSKHRGFAVRWLSVASRDGEVTMFDHAAFVYLLDNECNRVLGYTIGNWSRLRQGM